MYDHSLVVVFSLDVEGAAHMIYLFFIVYVDLGLRFLIHDCHIYISKFALAKCEWIVQIFFESSGCISCSGYNPQTSSILEKHHSLVSLNVRNLGQEKNVY